MTHRYLLDTNAVSDIMRRPTGSVAQTAAAHAGACVTSVVVLAELRYGIAKKKSVRLADALDRVLVALPVLSFTSDAVNDYAAIRTGLGDGGEPIGPLDTLIAAHALSEGLTVVTNNTKEFGRVPNLLIEDWSA